MDGFFCFVWVFVQGEGAILHFHFPKSDCFFHSVASTFDRYR